MRRWFTLLASIVLALGIAGCATGPIMDHGESVRYPCWPLEEWAAVYEHFLSWSSDGAHLAFSHEKTIRVLSVADSKSNPLVVMNEPGHYPRAPHFGFYGDISPDGARIIYSACDFATVEDEAPEANLTHYHHEVAVASLDGTGRQRLTENTYFDHFPV